MGELQLFLSAVWDNWVAVMSGVISLLIGIYEKIKDKTIKSSIFFFVAFLCVFIAFFMAWRDEHRMVITLENRFKSPEFHTRISAINSGIHNSYAMISVTCEIRNPFGPPSALHSWSMYLKFADGTIVKGETPPFSGENITAPAPPPLKGLFVLPADRYLPLYTGRQPIQAGGLVDGWTWAVFPQYTLDEIYEKKPTLIIEFMDVIADKKHEITTSDLASGTRVPKSWIHQK